MPAVRVVIRRSSTHPTGKICLQQRQRRHQRWRTEKIRADTAEGKQTQQSSGSGSSSSSSSSPKSTAGGGDDALAPGSVAGAEEAAKPGKRQIKLRVLPPSEEGRSKEKEGFPTAGAPAVTAAVAAAAGDGAEEGREEAIEATDEGVSSPMDSGDSSSVVKGGKEAAMARLAGAQGGVNEGANDGDDGGEGPSPMEVSAPTVSLAGSGSGYESVAEGDDGAAAETSASGGSGLGADEVECAGGDPSGLNTVACDEDGGTEGVDQGSHDAK